MVEVIKKGAYLVDGQIDQAQNVATPDEAREKTIAYSILRAHNKGKDPKKMQIKFDALISHDITFVGIIQTAKASGLKEFPIPYAMTNCHNSLCAVGGTINEDDMPSVCPLPRNMAASMSLPTRLLSISTPVSVWPAAAR